jgi:hypothetical protein
MLMKSEKKKKEKGSSGKDSAEYRCSHQTRKE